MTPRGPTPALTITFAALLLALLIFGIIQSNRRTELKLSAGQPGGMDFPVAESIARLIEQEAPVIESDGSARRRPRARS